MKKSVAKIFFGLCYGIGMVILVAGASLNGQNLFAKVSSKYPMSDFSLCLLGTKNLRNTYRPKMLCINYCAQNPSCYLACYDDSNCYLYNATVSIYYKADNSQYQPTTELTKVCYSSFVEGNDLTPQIVGTLVSSIYPANGLVPSLAFDGYFCPLSKLSFVSYYSSQYNNAPEWFVADLGKTYKIQKLLVQTRSWENYFNNIEVRIGSQNSPNNPLWVSYPGPTPLGSIVVLQGTSPASGRFISITALSNFLVLPDLKIIGTL